MPLRESQLRHTPILRPLYAESFQCIGPACEDTCCRDWRIDVDAATLARYRALPESPLRVLLDRHVVNHPETSAGPDGVRPGASIQMLPSGECPLLGEDRLCRIHAELGEDHLCATCGSYPRTIHTIDGFAEQPLVLSCPEAVRHVLLAPALTLADAHQIDWDDHALPGVPVRSYFWVIREFVIRLLLDRNYALWERLFLLGVFARRLDAFASGGQGHRTVPGFLSDFSSAVRSGGLRSAMESIPADLPLQLNLVLSLADLGLRKGAALPQRLLETLQNFASGIGHGRDVALDSQVAAYQAAHREFYEPFFLGRPHILENYLVNQVFRTAFPFGAGLFDPEAMAQIARSYASLVTQFALIKGLLIGVAGHHGAGFSADHVVQTVYTTVRHFEHSPRFLSESLQMLEDRKLDDARGLTMLLRN